MLKRIQRVAAIITFVLIAISIVSSFSPVYGGVCGDSQNPTYSWDNPFAPDYVMPAVDLKSVACPFGYLGQGFHIPHRLFYLSADLMLVAASVWYWVTVIQLYRGKIRSKTLVMRLGFDFLAMFAFPIFVIVLWALLGYLSAIVARATGKRYRTEYHRFFGLDYSWFF